MASKDKVFLDTDVALDHLADRQPFADSAHRLLGLAETGEITVCLSSLSFSNLYYILRKLKGRGNALALLGKLKRLVRVSAVTESEVQSAKAEGGVGVIVTRNKAHYTASEIPVCSPDEFLAKRERLSE